MGKYSLANCIFYFNPDVLLWFTNIKSFSLFDGWIMHPQLDMYYQVHQVHCVIKLSVGQAYIVI